MTKRPVNQRSRRDIYAEITNAIVADLERGVRPWHKPWSAGNLDGRAVLPRRHNGIAYRGVNILALWMAGVARGYRSPTWMTFRQAIELGGCVRKGEKGNLTVYANSLRRMETDARTGEEVEAAIHYMKGYTVFNVEQIDGLPPHYYAPPETPRHTLPRIEQAEAFFASTRAEVRHGGNRAFYAQGDDRIQMPPFEAFDSPEAYYATLAHETVHWTKAPTRLHREFGRKRTGDSGYAMEELVAELGAAFLCAQLDLSPQPREHASYLAHWLDVLKADSRAIFWASAHAQRAADFLQGLQQPDREAA